MSNEILSGIAVDIEKINENIIEARVLISAMKEAGEETAKLEGDLRTLEIRKQRWERMLENRGFAKEKK